MVSKRILEIYNSYSVPDDMILHMVRVASVAKKISRKLNISVKDIETIVDAALLHDIGKIMIPEEILYKPGKLNEDEFEIIKKHVEYSAEILLKEGIEISVIELVKHHHEKFDGTGYPYGLKRNKIPIGSQILSVADVFDALTSDRPYRRKMTVQKALKIMEIENFKAEKISSIKSICQNM